MNLQNLWDKYDNPCTIHSRCEGDDKEVCEDEEESKRYGLTSGYHCYCIGGVLGIHNLEFLKGSNEELFSSYINQYLINDIAFPNTQELTNVITSVFDVPNNDEHLDVISYYAERIISYNDKKEFDTSRLFVQKLFDAYEYLGEPIG